MMTDLVQIFIHDAAAISLITIAALMALARLSV